MPNLLRIAAILLISALALPEAYAQKRSKKRHSTASQVKSAPSATKPAAAVDISSEPPPPVPIPQEHTLTPKHKKTKKVVIVPAPPPPPGPDPVPPYPKR